MSYIEREKGRVTFLKQKAFYLTYSNESRHGEEHFHMKNYLLEIPPSRGKMALKTLPQKHKFLMTKAIWKSYTLNCSYKCPCTFLHSYTASFLRKVILCKTNNIFCSQEYWVWCIVNAIFWKFIKNKLGVTLDSFPNFADVSSYLTLKIFPWKRDYEISQKIQMPQNSTRPF